MPEIINYCTFKNMFDYLAAHGYVGVRDQLHVLVDQHPISNPILLKNSVYPCHGFSSLGKHLGIKVVFAVWTQMPGDSLLWYTVVKGGEGGGGAGVVVQVVHQQDGEQRG